MTVINAYSAGSAPFVDPKTGILTQAAHIFLRGIYDRIDGARGYGTLDLAIAPLSPTSAVSTTQDESIDPLPAIPTAQDSSIDPVFVQQMLDNSWALGTQIGIDNSSVQSESISNEVAYLRAEVDRLFAMIQALQQGTDL